MDNTNPPKDSIEDKKVSTNPTNARMNDAPVVVFSDDDDLENHVEEPIRFKREKHKRVLAKRRIKKIFPFRSGIDELTDEDNDEELDAEAPDDVADLDEDSKDADNEESDDGHDLEGFINDDSLVEEDSNDPEESHSFTDDEERSSV
ncbi:hypothetical protein Tco_0417370 [Tanacetum coccineum]